MGWLGSMKECRESSGEQKCVPTPAVLFMLLEALGGKMVHLILAIDLLLFSEADKFAR